MTETVVRVTTLEQWKSVLDVWYKEGHYWLFTNTKYQESIFEDGGRYLFLDDYITYSKNNHHDKPYVEYSEFMAGQKEDKKVKTYYVNKKKLTIIEKLKITRYPLYQLLNNDDYYSLSKGLDNNEEKALLRYLGGDETVEFKLKDPLHRLWRMETNDRIYMRINDFGTPIWTAHKDNAFTAPLEEIKKWQTPAWSVEEVN